MADQASSNQHKVGKLWTKPCKPAAALVALPPFNAEFLVQEVSFLLFLRGLASCLPPPCVGKVTLFCTSFHHFQPLCGAKPIFPLPILKAKAVSYVSLESPSLELHHECWTAKTSTHGAHGTPKHMQAWPIWASSSGPEMTSLSIKAFELFGALSFPCLLPTLNTYTCL